MLEAAFYTYVQETQRWTEIIPAFTVTFALCTVPSQQSAVSLIMILFKHSEFAAQTIDVYWLLTLLLSVKRLFYKVSTSFVPALNRYNSITDSI